MKQSEILQLNQTIAVLDGKGSTRLKWAVYRTSDKLEAAAKELMKFIEELKPEKLKKLQKEQAEILQKCKTKDEQKTAMLNWSKAGELQAELQKFIESKKYQDFMNSDNEEFKPYPITLEKADIEGIEFNNQAFWVLEKIANGLEKVME